MDKLIIMPERLTAENGAKYAFSREFFETVTEPCIECFNAEEVDYDCEFCHGDGYVEQKVYISWTNIKEIYQKARDIFGAEITRGDAKKSFFTAGHYHELDIGDWNNIFDDSTYSDGSWILINDENIVWFGKWLSLQSETMFQAIASSVHLIRQDIVPLWIGADFCLPIGEQSILIYPYLLGSMPDCNIDIPKQPPLYPKTTLMNDPGPVPGSKKVYRRKALFSGSGHMPKRIRNTRKNA